MNESDLHETREMPDETEPFFSEANADKSGKDLRVSRKTQPGRAGRTAGISAADGRCQSAGGV
ncbi:hypothetical protein DENIS_2861 [Desulfonema ishimotonii]|uniref:Uncharacterized protein n=1 Tax=Desulfonema ishimotonii TaxID=45657 RepID=A0A401FY58_9BACT|nr:hypothetical protein DENIS_2861 [Desulfonema ishimotonii]